MKRPLLLPILLCGLHASLTWVSAAPRVALVIGNSRYSGLPDSRQLSSPVADAGDIAAALSSLGYTIVTGGPVTDAGRERMTTVTEQFATAAKDAEAAVFYYSGHGVQVGDDNFLLPSDTPALTGISVLKNRTVLLRDSVMVALEEANAATKVIILDCCRDNPFSAQLAAVLAQTGKSVKTKSVGEITGYGPGFYLAFATSPGSTAADGNGQRNSPFTAAMLQAMPGSSSKDIDFFFRDVKTLLPDDQVSWTNHSIKGSFIFNPKSVAPNFPKPPAIMDPVTPAPVDSPLDQPVIGKPLVFTLPGGEKLTMQSIPAGSFTMGSPATEVGRSGDENQVNVTLMENYWLGKTEFTQGQWKAVMGSNPSIYKGDDLPVETVSWDDVQQCLAKMQTKVPHPKGWRWSLPTEAQWEYACRAGTVTAFSFGPKLSSTEANFDVSKPVGVGSYRPNGWGLYDMHGNVGEWCEDAWTVISRLSGGSDPLGKIGTGRVFRGGSWNVEAASCRAANRNRYKPGLRDSNLGFRPALVPSG
jgi:formylglycine-generating enzyme required for sulfatase activity